MTTLSEKFKFYNTHDADADAGDIREGKIAYTNGGKVVGTIPATSAGALLYHAFPAVGGLYTPVLADIQHYAPGMYLSGAGNAWSSDSNGVLTCSEDHKQLYYFGLPAKTLTGRLYHWQLHSAASPVSAEEWAIIWNALDGNNHMLFLFDWTGTYWRFRLYNRQAGALGSQLWTASYGATFTDAAVFDIMVYDFGDRNSWVIGAYEKTDPANVQTLTGTYTTASRPNKDEVGLAFGTRTSNVIGCRMVSVMDFGAS